MQFGRLSRKQGTISKVVYVDLLDSYKTPVIQVRTGTDGSTGAGVFRIPDTLRTGSYFIRSFTNLMKNYPQALFAYKKISVINPFESLGRLSVPPVNAIPDSVIFYPETGHIVTGIGNRVGFQCFNKNGDPVITEGVITGSGEDTLALFSTDRYGTGMVSVNPPSAGSLYMVTSDSTGRSRRFEMPSVDEKGLTFRVASDRQAGVIKIHILKNKGFDVPEGRLGIIYSHSSFPLVRKEISAERDSVIVLGQDVIPAGLAKIMITDIKGIVLASGWYYNDKTQDLTYEVKVDLKIFLRGEKSELKSLPKMMEGTALKAISAFQFIRPVLKDGSHYNEIMRQNQSPAMQALRTDLIFPWTE